MQIVVNFRDDDDTLLFYSSTHSVIIETTALTQTRVQQWVKSVIVSSQASSLLFHSNRTAVIYPFVYFVLLLSKVYFIYILLQRLSGQSRRETHHVHDYHTSYTIMFHTSILRKDLKFPHEITWNDKLHESTIWTRMKSAPEQLWWYGRQRCTPFTPKRRRDYSCYSVYTSQSWCERHSEHKQDGYV